MPFGSVIAILCAIFVIFLIPYFEKRIRKNNFAGT
ncbi:erm Leader peptide [Staphylococcus xylosus]